MSVILTPREACSLRGDPALLVAAVLPATEGSGPLLSFNKPRFLFLVQAPHVDCWGTVETSALWTKVSSEGSSCHSGCTLAPGLSGEVASAERSEGLWVSVCSPAEHLCGEIIGNGGERKIARVMCCSPLGTTCSAGFDGSRDGNDPPATRALLGLPGPPLAPLGMTLS